MDPITRHVATLLLGLCVIATPATAQWVHSIKAKMLTLIDSGGRTVELAIPPEDTPGFQRFRIFQANGDWAIQVVTPDGTRVLLNADTIVNHVSYDDVIEIPTPTPGIMTFTGSVSSPSLRQVSAVVGHPSPINKYPFGDFNLVPAASWPVTYRTSIEPTLVVLWSSGKFGVRPCNATQIMIGIFLTAHHCVRDVVDSACRPLASGTLRIFTEPRPLNAYNQPTPEALASAVGGAPVFCGSSNVDNAVPSTLDYAVITTAVPVRSGAVLPPIAAPVPANGTNLLLAAYLSETASGQSGDRMETYPPDLYLSRDSECRVPLPAVEDRCPLGQIVHKCDSWPTMSGAAVLRRADASLIGVHYFWTGHANCALPWATILSHMRANAVTAQQRAVVAKFP